MIKGLNQSLFLAEFVLQFSIVCFDIAWNLLSMVAACSIGAASNYK